MIHQILYKAKFLFSSSPTKNFCLLFITFLKTWKCFAGPRGVVLVTTAMLPVVAGRISDWLIAVVVRGGQVTPSPPPPYLATAGEGHLHNLHKFEFMRPPVFAVAAPSSILVQHRRQPGPHAEYK